MERKLYSCAEVFANPSLMHLKPDRFLKQVRVVSQAL